MWLHILGFVSLLCLSKVIMHSIVEPFLLNILYPILVYRIWCKYCKWVPLQFRKRTAFNDILDLTWFYCVWESSVPKQPGISYWIGNQWKSYALGIPRVSVEFQDCFPHVRGIQRAHTAAAGNWVSLPNTACPAAGRLMQRVQAWRVPPEVLHRRVVNMLETMWIYG